MSIAMPKRPRPCLLAFETSWTYRDIFLIQGNAIPSILLRKHYALLWGAYRENDDPLEKLYISLRAALPRPDALTSIPANLSI